MALSGPFCTRVEQSMVQSLRGGEPCAGVLRQVVRVCGRAFGELPTFLQLPHRLTQILIENTEAESHVQYHAEL